ncbi:hypothetical protein [Bradyrhizobium japonicum]|nr:hypothetical protein [Bradyrhizobium japonicum]
MKTIPRPEELHPPLREALKRDTDHSLALAPLMARAMVLRAEERDQPATHVNVAEENRIRALTGLPPLVGVPSQPELETILRKIQDLKTARGREAGTIQRERAVASRMVCEEVKEEVTRLGRNFAKAFIDLYAAHSAYTKMFDAIEDAGASTSALKRVWSNALGGISDRSGPYHYIFEELHEANLIGKSSIPEAVR